MLDRRALHKKHVAARTLLREDLESVGLLVVLPQGKTQTFRSTRWCILICVPYL